MDWLVLDMDDGVVRREPTRKAAVDWLTGLTEGKVLSRYSYGPGAYEYRVGLDMDDCASWFVEREDVADDPNRKGGWDITQRPTYPHPDDPYQYEERD